MECNTVLGRKAEKDGSRIKKQNAKSKNNAISDKSIENPMNKANVNFVTLENNT